MSMAVTSVAEIPGLAELWQQTQGAEEICIAVLDGPVDLTHASFEGANIKVSGSPWSTPLGNGRMSAHGTHVASVLFGQPGGPIPGIAPGCRGLIIPIFSDEQEGPTPQTELARAINRAVDEGAHVINISGGELSASGQAEALLAQAVRNCAEHGVLVVAAAGNDACQCLHVPAALPSVLAVGAMDGSGVPLAMTNWGETYLSQGILAPGDEIPGATPGGGMALKTGTSFATPIVSGVVGLLLSLQMLRREPPSPLAVRDALLSSATPCREDLFDNCQRFLAGTLNISGAIDLLFSGEPDMSDQNLATAVVAEPGLAAGAVSSEAGIVAAEGGVVESAVAGATATADAPVAPVAEEPRSAPAVRPAPAARGSSPSAAVVRGGPAPRAAGKVRISEGCSCGGTPEGKQLVYALGVVGYDFGTEARRDSFKQLMPGVRPDEKEGLIPAVVEPGTSPEYTVYPPNPYDARQMVNYLCGYPRPEVPYPTEWGFGRVKYDGKAPPTALHGPAFPPTAEFPKGYLLQPAALSEACQLIWTLNIELTPIYAVRPAGVFAEVAYLRLVQALAGQVRPKNDVWYVSRVSVPGVLTGETVRLFSGQVVPVLEPQPRGMYAWNERGLVEDALGTIGDNLGIDVLAYTKYDPKEREEALKDEKEAENLRTSDRVKKAIDNYLNKIYYELRNMGQTPAERALNYAATNIFNLTSIVEDEASKNTQLDTIEVEQSAFCRMDSVCMDVKIRFFDPDEVRRARTVYRSTVDVSDVTPVTVGEIRSWQDAI
jgi:subtilisin family serine protease